MRFRTAHASIENIAKGHTCVSRAYFEDSLDTDKVVSSQGLHLWSLNNFQAIKGGKFHCQILERVLGLVHQQDAQCDVELLNTNICLHIDGIGESSQLHNFAELGGDLLSRHVALDCLI